MKKIMLDSAIEDWIEAIISYSTLIKDRHDHIHIDELLGKNTVSRQETVAISVQAFQKLIECAVKLGTPVKLSLNIPMKSLGNEISLSVPQNIQDITSQLDFEPPSLWVIDWQSFFSPTLLSPIVLEEYRSPLRFSMIEGNDRNIVAYYHEHRTKEEFDANEEIARRVYIDCFKYKAASSESRMANL